MTDRSIFGKCRADRRDNVNRKNLPDDYAIDAMALEAERRGKELGRPYSYGKLMASTTEAERDEIKRNYRASGGTGGRKAAFLEKRKEAEEAVKKKLEPENEDT